MNDNINLKTFKWGKTKLLSSFCDFPMGVTMRQNAIARARKLADRSNSNIKWLIHLPNHG